LTIKSTSNTNILRCSFLRWPPFHRFRSACAELASSWKLHYL
jgi:hypothetical protein